MTSTRTALLAPQPRAGGVQPLHAVQPVRPGGPSALEGLPEPVSGSGRHARLSIIAHSHLRWDFVWQRPQQVLSRLAQHHPVLFVEDAVDGNGPARIELSQPLDNLVRAVPVVPGCSRDSVDATCASILPLLARELRSHPLLAPRFATPVQWFYSPLTAPAFIGRFGALGAVYDCMDELANFRFAPPDIEARERFLLARCGVVFTGGYGLYESRSRQHANTHFHGCGVDVDHFGKARCEQTVVPAELAALAQPILGYFGVIDERLDYRLIERLADDLPHASIVMIGPVAKVDPATLPRRGNIHWLGQRAYADLPTLVKGFDVCLMPFAINAATRYINPTKTLEYMAAARPIVSTAIAEVIRNFTPVVQVAGDADAFVRLVAKAARAPDPARIAAGIALAHAASWDSIVAQMRAHMLGLADGVADGVAKSARDARLRRPRRAVHDVSLVRSRARAAATDA